MTITIHMENQIRFLEFAKRLPQQLSPITLRTEGSWKCASFAGSRFFSFTFIQLSSDGFAAGICWQLMPSGKHGELIQYK